MSRRVRDVTKGAGADAKGIDTRGMSADPDIDLERGFIVPGERGFVADDYIGRRQSIHKTNLSQGEPPPSYGQWSYGVEDFSGCVSDDISDIGDPPDVTCNDLSDDESDCEYSDEDSVSSTESYNDFIRRRAQAVLAAKEAWINLKFERKRAEIYYKLLDMEKEAQLLQLKVDTMDEILFFKQTGCVKIRSKPLDSVSDTHRGKVFDTHPSVEVKGTVVEQKTTDCAIDQISDPSVACHGDIPFRVNSVAPPVICDSRVAQLKAGTHVIIEHLKTKIIGLQSELSEFVVLPGQLDESWLLQIIDQLDALESLPELQTDSAVLINHLRNNAAALEMELSALKCNETADVPEMEVDSGYESQSSSSEYVSQPSGGESLCMEPSDGVTQPSSGNPGSFCDDRTNRSSCMENVSSGTIPSEIVRHTSLPSSSAWKYKVKLKHSSESVSSSEYAPLCGESVHFNHVKWFPCQESASDLLGLL